MLIRVACASDDFQYLLVDHWEMMTTATTKIAEALHEVHNLILVKGTSVFTNIHLNCVKSTYKIWNKKDISLSEIILLSPKDGPCSLFKVPTAAGLNGMQCTTGCWRIWWLLCFTWFLSTALPIIFGRNVETFTWIFCFLLGYSNRRFHSAAFWLYEATMMRRQPIVQDGGRGNFKWAIWLFFWRC